MATTYIDALKSINAYPIPQRVFDTIAIERGVDMDDVLTAEGARSKAYRLAKADILMWLSGAPNISQGGQSYTFSDEQRDDMRNEAQGIYNAVGVQDEAVGVVYGYKGDRL